MGVGKAVLVDCAQPIQRVAMGSGDVAEATAISPTEIMITGKGAGRNQPDYLGHSRRPPVLQRDGAAQRALMGDNLDAIRRELRTELPGQAIRVSYEQQQRFSARHGEGSDQLRRARCRLPRRRARW